MFYESKHLVFLFISFPFIFVCPCVFLCLCRGYIYFVKMFATRFRRHLRAKHINIILTISIYDRLCDYISVALSSIETKAVLFVLYLTSRIDSLHGKSTLELPGRLFLFFQIRHLTHCNFLRPTSSPYETKHIYYFHITKIEQKNIFLKDFKLSKNP